MKRKRPKQHPKINCDGDKVSEHELVAAHRVAAQLVVSHGDEFLGLFERLDTELGAKHKDNETRARAAKVVAGTTGNNRAR